MNRKRITAALRRAAAFLGRVKFSLAVRGVAPARRLWRAAPLIVVFIFLTLLLEYGGWLRSFESAALDTFLFLKEPLAAEHVVIVGITKEDYKEYFGERSPLDAGRLQQIVDAIAAGHPAVIGVDLDTASESFKDLRPPAGPPVVVWARDAERVAPGTQGEDGGIEDRSASDVGKGLLRHFLPFIFKPEEERFSVSGVLGRGGNAFPSGVALVPRDSDSAIRRYRRQFKTTEPDAPVMDSFSWAVVKAYVASVGRAVETEEESDEGWVLNFAADQYSFRPIRIGELLERSQWEGWRGERGPLKDKIVLLGGIYPASRDRHYTPAGPRYGVELIAYAVESDIQGRTVRPPNKYTVWFAELLVGFTLVLVHARFRDRPKPLRYTVVAVPLLALLASFFVFSSLALWAFFLPVLLAVLIQQLYEDVQEYRKQKVHEIYKEADGLGQDVRQVMSTIRAETAAAASSRVDEAPANLSDESDSGQRTGGRTQRDESKPEEAPHR